MKMLETVAITEVDVRGVELPAKGDPKVVALIESISEVGQLAPVLVTQGMKLISGRHRYVALKALKAGEIDVKVVDLDELGIRLARIDENLVRQVLTALERGVQLKERKRIYEAMHPQAKHGAAPGKKGGGKAKDATVASFARDTAAKTGTAERTVQQYVQVAERLDPEASSLIASTPSANSITDLTKLARLGAEQQREVAALVKADPSGKTTVKRAVKKLRTGAALKNVLEYRPPVGSFSVIVSDVSWEYDDKLDGSDEARGGVDYATQKLDEILAMKIPAADDCALWFCVTNQFLMDGTAARVLAKWDFTPKALLTWRKVDSKGNDRLGSGHYLQNNTEHVILAVRGKPVVNGAGQPSCFDAPRTSRHSEKPDRLFEIIEKVTPCDPSARAELNARKARPGWAGFGADLQAEERANRRDAHEPKVEAETETSYIDRAAAAGWEPSPSGWAKKVDGIMWCVEVPNGKKTWEAYRPKQGELRARNADGFATAEEAMKWVDSVAGGAAELKPIIAWTALTNELPFVSRGVGPTARYQIVRSGKRFRWDMFFDRGHPVSKQFGSKDFDSVELAQADAEHIETGRAATDAILADKKTTEPQPEDVSSWKSGVAHSDGLTGPSIPQHQYDPRLPEGMGGPHDWHPINSSTDWCRRCEARHSRVGKPRTGCPKTPAESMFDRMQRDAQPKKNRRLPIVEVPSTPISPQIVWTAKVHPSKIAVGVADSGRRYAIDRVRNKIVGGPDKKGRVRRVSQSDLAQYRWFCTTDGASSLKDFDTLEQAKTAATEAERGWLRANGKGAA